MSSDALVSPPKVGVESYPAHSISGVVAAEVNLVNNG